MARIDFGHTWWGERWLAPTLAHLENPPYNGRKESFNGELFGF